MLDPEDRATLFSEATIDNGRVFVTVVPLDKGRCCHDIVLDRVGAIAALGELCEAIDGFESDSVFSGVVSCRLGDDDISSGDWEPR